MEIIKLAIEEAKRTIEKGLGGPFGSVIVDKNNNVIVTSSNTVIGDKDPTAHAEVNAIRKACKKLNTYDLSDYVLYTTSYPCPMCLSAIIWANIKKVYYACDAKEAEKVGFRDKYIYEFITNNIKDKEILNIEKIDDTDSKKMFDDYIKNNRIIY